ncbi:MAG: M16 family metallopeptidase [Vicinamibacterales bacterium]
MRACIFTRALLVAAGTLTPIGLLAQAPPAAVPPGQTTKGIVAKGKAPVSDSVLQVKLPRPQEGDLASGLHLMVLEDRRVPQITFQLLIPGAGGYYDPAELPGLASFTAAVMREGTASRTSLQISEQLETLGATLGVSASMSSTEASIGGSSLTEHFDQLMDLAGDLLLDPSFPEDELGRYKQRTRAQLVQQRSNPGFLANEMISRVLYGAHPAARQSPTSQALDAVTRAQLVEFHKARYAPDYAVLAIAGDISFAQARKVTEAKLAAWKKQGVSAPAVADPQFPSAPKVHLVARPSSVQTSFVVGAPGIDRISPDYDVLQVMNKVVGGGPTGRLFILLREDKGYTYAAYSGLTAGRYKGDWYAYTDVRNEVTAPALKDLIGEVTRIRDEVVPDKEFRDAKRSMVAAFALSLESPQAVLNNHITRWRYKLPADYWDRYPERIAAVTQAQVQEAAKKYLDPSRLQVVAVGDAKIADILKGYGTLEVYDTEGKRISN